MAFFGFLAGALLGGLAGYALGASSWHWYPWPHYWAPYYYAPYYYAPAYYAPSYYQPYYPAYPSAYRGYPKYGYWW